tara:strand:+ start:218 stop:394 length:177 start_codon:yes stop_codon:yes gene_type:complete
MFWKELLWIMSNNIVRRVGRSRQLLLTRIQIMILGFGCSERRNNLYSFFSFGIGFQVS